MYGGPTTQLVMCRRILLDTLISGQMAKFLHISTESEDVYSDLECEAVQSK